MFMLDRWLLFVCCLAFLGAAAPLRADLAASGPAVERVEPVVHDGALFIEADTRFELSGELRDAAYRGVTLYFTADVEIVSRRWWWFDKVIVDDQQTWRVVYNALTRQWRVGSGDLALPESSLDAALDPIRHIRGWPVAETASLDPGETYEGRIRLRLDTSLLARPFQVNAINSSAWSLATPWKNFSFSITDGDSSN